MSLRKIALYGKAGIGKSTIACNLSIALTELGERVFQVGCSANSDSTSLLVGGRLLKPTIMDQIMQGKVNKPFMDECIREGYGGILCAEVGNPDPTEGCFGRGILLAMELIAKHRVLEDKGITFLIYDVIGDIICGGFAHQSLHSSYYANEIYLITSGELMSLYCAYNIAAAVRMIVRKKGGSLGIGGIINNMRGIEDEETLVTKFGNKLKVPVLAHIPKSKIFQEVEAESGSVLEKRPHSPIAEIFRSLAEKILRSQHNFIPEPMNLEEIMELLRNKG